MTCNAGGLAQGVTGALVRGRQKKIQGQFGHKHANSLAFIHSVHQCQHALLTRHRQAGFCAMDKQPACQHKASTSVDGISRTNIYQHESITVEQSPRLAEGGLLVALRLLLLGLLLWVLRATAALLLAFPP